MYSSLQFLGAFAGGAVGGVLAQHAGAAAVNPLARASAFAIGVRPRLATMSVTFTFWPGTTIPSSANASTRSP